MKVVAVFIFAFMSTALFASKQVLSELVYEIRDPKTEGGDFRSALERIGEYLALDVLNELSTEQKSIQTLTGKEAKHHLVDEKPVLITILRAGLPLNAGVQKVFPNAEVGFLAMSRDEETLKAKVEYIALPEIKNRSVIITDTMLATGGSMIDAVQIIEAAEPKKIYIISAIASEPGIERVLAHNPNIKIFAAVVDPFLNEKGYIIPGLGDAGDRSYGKKHIHSLTASSLQYAKQS